MHPLVPAGLALALAAPIAAQADNAADLQALRQEIATMRADYEARLKALEDKLQAAQQAQAVAAPPSAPTPSPSPPPPASVAAAPDAGANAGATAFNPALSLILSGTYVRASQDPSTYRIARVPLPADAEIGPGPRSFNLGESELGIAASIDPWLRGAANISLHGDDSVSVEEAFVQTTALSDGLSLKAGRFFSGVGYLNSQHSHTWDFADNPLAYQAFLGTQYGDDGVQLHWLAPTDLYLELGAEAGRGRSFPGGGTRDNGAGMLALTAHAGDDIGDSSSWRAGLSVLNARAANQALAAFDADGNAIANAFTGRTRVWVADAVWKWAPHGNATRTNFKLQGEWLHSQRDGSLAYDVDGLDRSDGFRSSQDGWYLQGVWQFMPRWRVGLRTEALEPGTPEAGINTAALLNAFNGSGLHPRKNTLMLDFNASEFSRVRVQLAQDRARADGTTDTQLVLQYQMSLGAHGAHSY